MRAPTGNDELTQAAPRARSRSRTGNRKLPQRRGLRLPPLSLRPILRGVGRGLKAVAPLAITAGALTLVVLGARHGWRWLTTTPRFAVTHVEVPGHEHVTPERVVAATGLRLGQDNLFALSTSELEAAVALDPWVAQVSIERDLPDGLVVHVRERKPIALLVADGAYLLDETGTPFKRAATEIGEGAGLPVVTGIPRGLYRTGAEAAATVAQHAVGVVNAWNQPGRPAVGEVNVSARGLILYTAEGAVALRLGRVRQEDLSDRLRRFDAAWSALSPEEQKSARVIYLDSDTRNDRVTARLADAR